ncbi:RNA methyltransferase [Saccharicrinis fermentans]|uniref:tRNA (Guanosine(18)-2'-O)-methyltransferase n=1 Tax=Saccharicrinis fermentans DSM 9555 = JCM 21142 TaxID=869213 RepID=W7YNG9_9BACT|nr:RNA methyltransferase [Saccharicrinis fermentans]GAF03979.1 tRNA (guanosine(18)-2'-O)-methyltransferase [Saccharicrinis fermentans DSM 9555 = JCM 21142]
MRKLRNKELNRLSVEEFKASAKTPIIALLDNVRSLNNVGSVFRTSDALCLEEIYLCGITPTPPHNDIHKTALGAEDSMTWSYHENTLTAVIALQKQGYKVYCVEQAEGSTSLIDFKPAINEKIALVFGNEVKGVQQTVIDSSDGCIEIPQFGTKHSLNISVSAGIVLWEATKQMRGMV